jgi:hypothetical protein
MVVSGRFSVKDFFYVEEDLKKSTRRVTDTCPNLTVQ